MENTEIKNSTTFIECDIVMLKKQKRDYNGKHLTLLGLVKNTLDYGESNDDFHNAAWAIQQDLYVLIDEEPQEGDFYYNPEINSIQKHLGGSQSIITKRDYCKKVVATTNIDLNLPKVSIDFIQKYIYDYNKGTPIKKILVEFDNNQSCSLYPKKCCGNPLYCSEGGECSTEKYIVVNHNSEISTKLIENKSYSIEDLKKSFYAGREQRIVHENDSGTDYEFVNDFEEWVKNLK